MNKAVLETTKYERGWAWTVSEVQGSNHRLSYAESDCGFTTELDATHAGMRFCEVFGLDCSLPEEEELDNE